MFLTIFAVVSLKSFAGALILVLFVHWQTLAVVLTRPTATGCLQKEFTVIIHFMAREIMKNYLSKRGSAKGDSGLVSRGSQQG